MMLRFILLFTIIISPVFVYGLGLDRLLSCSHSPKRLVLSLMPDLLFMLLVTSIIWFLSQYVLKPFRLSFLMPLFFVILFSVLEELYYVFYKKATETTLTEKGFSYGISFFLLYTATSYLELIAIMLLSVLSFICFGLLLFILRRRIDDCNAGYGLKIAPLLLISLGFVNLALYALDFSWLF